MSVTLAFFTSLAVSQTLLSCSGVCHNAVKAIDGVIITIGVGVKWDRQLISV